MVVGPSINTREIDEVVRSLPGVERVTSDILFSTTLDDDRPRSRGEVETSGLDTFVRGSSDGRYTEMDRPALISGRMPTARHEAAITADAVERARPGDRRLRATGLLAPAPQV